jgi:exopolysaccharide production protein ExoQ
MNRKSQRVKSPSGQLSARAPDWKLSSFFISAAIYLTLFQSISGIGQILSFLAISILFIVSLFAAAQAREQRLEFNFFDVWAILITLLSAAAFFTEQNENSAYFTLIFALACAAVSLIAKSIPLRNTLMALAVAHGAMTVTALALYPEAILTSLNPGSAMRWSLRVRPFNLHPNLVGFMFSGGAILQIYAATISKSRQRKMLYGALAVASLMVAVAASARAGLLAFFVSAIVVGLLYSGRLYRTKPRAFLACLGGGFLAALALAPSALSYANIVFELDSQTRGLNSGGSGRVDRWMTSIEYWTKGNVFIGSGLRTVGVEGFGFSSTENSYLNIAIENGLLGLAVSLVLIAYALGVFSRKRPGKDDLLAAFAVWIIVYALIQSMFNRYLIAIGNNLSLTILFIISGAFGQIAKRKAPAPAPAPTGTPRAQPQR